MAKSIKQRLSSVDPMTDEADGMVPALNRQVGLRVMSVRKSQRLSRRELSERSGVSPRYLATLEGGDGNISVGVLKKLAIALNTPVEFFLTDDDHKAQDNQRLLNLFWHADTDTRSRVIRMLDPVQLRAQKAQRVCLVGLRGAGKTTLGERISARFDAPFIELNTEIARAAGMPVGEIIALYGQEGYRQLEADTLLTLIASHDRAVIAVAGGIVSEKQTFDNVLAYLHTVWIKTSSAEHMDRVRAQGDLRPMQGIPEAMTQLKALLTAREALYAKADHALDTSGKTVDVSEAELAELINTHQILEPS